MQPNRRISPSLVVSIIAVVIALTGTAFAATGQLVNIADPGNSAQVAKVDTAGRLNVSDGGGSLTVDGTLTNREAAPNTLWHAFAAVGASDGCVQLYAPPAGKAAILRSITFDTYSVNTTGAGNWVGASLGKVGGSCGNLLTVVNPATVGATTVPFEPGVGIPAGGALFLQATGAPSAEASATGFLVPSAQVPASAEPAASAPASQDVQPVALPRRHR